MKQIFMTVNLKYKLKTFKCDWAVASLAPPYPLFNTIYINKIFKIIIQFKKLDTLY